MNWEFLVPTTIAGLSMVVGAVAFVRGEQRERRRLADLDHARLTLDVSRLSADALLLAVRYQPPGRHTRYQARVRVEKPAQALLSLPGWESSPGGFVAMPSPAYDPKERQLRAFTLELTDNWPFGADGRLGGRLVAHAPVRLTALTLDVKIQDVATGATMLRARKTLTA